VPVSFAKDILPLFRPVDIEHMKPLGVLLDDYPYMSDATNEHQNARDVQEFLAGKRQPRMPLGGPFWTAEHLNALEQWMKDGYRP
jgi:hypothetical protein